jgi:hypothetical protein
MTHVGSPSFCAGNAVLSETVREHKGDCEMSGTTDSSRFAQERKLAEYKLSDMVTTIEFTMVSVVAGLMLIPLIDYATPLVHDLRVEYWVYILTQLAIIMFFWTAMIAHALTFIGWPIDVVHNLLYLIFFPVVGIANHFMGDPRAFYPMLNVIAFLGVLLTSYDLSMIRRKRKGARGAAAELYQAAHSRQVTVVLLTLSGLFLTLLMSGLVAAFPIFFVEKHMHLVLGAGLFAFILCIEIREIRQLNRLRNKIFNKTIAEIQTNRTITKI